MKNEDISVKKKELANRLKMLYKKRGNKRPRTYWLYCL